MAGKRRRVQRIDLETGHVVWESQAVNTSPTHTSLPVLANQQAVLATVKEERDDAQELRR